MCAFNPPFFLHIFRAQIPISHIPYRKKSSLNCFMIAGTICVTFVNGLFLSFSVIIILWFCRCEPTGLAVCCFCLCFFFKKKKKKSGKQLWKYGEEKEDQTSIMYQKGGATSLKETSQELMLFSAQTVPSRTRAWSHGD